MNKTKTIAVQLTEDGARQLQPFLAYAKKNTVGYYFRCEEVDVSGPFFTMMIDTGVDGEHGSTIALNIPHAMVRWYVETEQENAIGFLKR